MHHPDSAGVSSNGKMAHQRIYPASGSNTGSDGGPLLSTPPNTVVNNVQIPVDECLLTQSTSVLSSQAPQQPPHNLSLHSLSSQSAGTQMKKKSGFQITSVTSAQVSVGTNNSIAEDTESYDDLDESHTEDMSSSEILDVSLSRANDLAGAERSSSEETLNNFHEVESPGAISPNQLSHLHLMNQSGTIVNGTVHHHYLHHHVTLRHPPQSTSPSASPSSTIGGILENTSSGSISSGGDVTSASVARMHSSVTGTTTGVINHQISNAGYVNVPLPNVFVRDNKSGSGNISNIEGVTGRVAMGANITETIQQDQTMNSTIISATFENANAAVAFTSGPAVIGLPNGNPGGSITQSSAAVTVVTVASVSLTQQQPLPTSAPTTTTTSSRFRVVKLDSSSEPFKKGRWTCTDYHDKDAPVSAPSFSTPEMTAPGMRAGESMQQNYSECFNSGAGRESTIGSSCTLSSTVSTQNYYTDTVGGGKVGRVQHSQDYVTSLQGFQTSLFNGLNMGVSQTETLIHKDFTQTTGLPSAQTGILQSVSMTGVQNPTGNPIFATSQQQLTYAQAVANQSTGSNKGPLMVHQQPAVTAQYGQSHQSIPQPAESQNLAHKPSGPGNANMAGGQHEQPMMSMPAQMRLQQTTSLQVNTFSVVPQMGVGGPDQQGKSNPIMLDRQQQQPLTTQGLLTHLPSASQVPSPANLKNYPLSMSQMHNGVNSGMALYASLPTFTTTQLEDAQRLLLQHQSALLGLPKLAEASSPASAAFGQEGNSSALTSTVFLKAIDGEDG